MLEAFAAAALRGREHVVGFFLQDTRATSYGGGSRARLFRLCVEDVVDEFLLLCLVSLLQIKCVGDLQQFGHVFCLKLFFCEIFHTFVYAFGLMFPPRAAMFQFLPGRVAAFRAAASGAFRVKA